MTSKLKLPDLKGIRIESISDADADLTSFLSDCIPLHLLLFSINWDVNSWIGIKSEFYIDLLLKAVSKVTKEVYFWCFDFSAKDLEQIIKAAHNSERLVFRFCCIHCSPNLDFGSTYNYNTKFLSFECWGSTAYKERTTDWKTDPSCFENIVDAIKNSGLKDSLQKVSIGLNQTLSKEKVQELFNNKGMSQITVTEEVQNPLSS